MEFPEFARLLKSVIGGSSNTKEFTKTLFETMVTDEAVSQIVGSEDTFKAYYNGHTSITKISKRVLANLEDENFVCYLDGFGDATAQILANTFEPHIEGITSMTASRDIGDLFIEILRNAARAERKSTPKGATCIENTNQEILEKKMFASGQVVVDALKNAVNSYGSHPNTTNFSLKNSVDLPEAQPATKNPYTLKDQILLQEFTTDYEEIMISLISENYGSSLIDMSLPNKIQKLYKTKWSSRADSFIDPSLKSHVFGLLGELNSISSLLSNQPSAPALRYSRTKIRNLYVKLHPDLFSKNFPYEAFIDDWNDGEF